MFLGCSPCCGGCPDWSNVEQCSVDVSLSVYRSEYVRGTATRPEISANGAIASTLTFFTDTGGGLLASVSEPNGFELSVRLRNIGGVTDIADRYLEIVCTYGFFFRFGFSYYPCGFPTFKKEPENPDLVQDLETRLSRQNAFFIFSDLNSDDDACSLTSYDWQVDSTIGGASAASFTGTKDNLGAIARSEIGPDCEKVFWHNSALAGPVIKAGGDLTLSLSSFSSLLTFDDNQYSYEWQLDLSSLILYDSSSKELNAFPHWFETLS